MRETYSQAGVPSMTCMPLAVGVSPASSYPAASNSDLNSSGVRSCPPGPTSMLRSPSFVSGRTVPSRTTLVLPAAQECNRSVSLADDASHLSTDGTVSYDGAAFSTETHP